MTLDAKLRWKAHVKKEREELEVRYNKMFWLKGRTSSLSLHNKLLIYKQILKHFGHLASNSGDVPTKEI